MTRFLLTIEDADPCPCPDPVCGAVIPGAGGDSMLFTPRTCGAPTGEEVPAVDWSGWTDLGYVDETQSEAPAIYTL